MLIVAVVRALLCPDPIHTRSSLLDASRGQAFLLLHVWGVTELQPVLLTARVSRSCMALLWLALRSCVSLLPDLSSILQ